MKFLIKFYRFYLNTLVVIAPRYAAKIAFKIFQKVTLKTFREYELPFYKIAIHFKVKLKGEDLQCYETGNSNGDLVFLVHGWNSNAGSLSYIGEALAKQNYRVISFDLPAHAFAKEKCTNLYECKEAFKELIRYINPQLPFKVVSHSFGAVVSAYALSEIDYKTTKLVVLSTNNNLEDIFKHFKKIIGFNAKVYEEFKRIIKNKFKEDVSKMITSDRLNAIGFDKLLIIHDKFDKVIPFSNAETIHKKVANSELIPFEKIGHYRMLWKENVVRETVDFLKN